MNKTIQEASLDNLHDIIVPDAIGFFPLAPGWIIVGVLLLTLLFHFVVQAYKRYKKTLYKREALTELENYRDESKDDALALLKLARRVAIAAYGREEIAGLSGDDWWEFMEQCSKVKVSRELRDEISTLLYDNTAQIDTKQFRLISSMVSVWIKTHQVSTNV